MHRLIGPDSDEPTKTVAYLARNRKFESISLQGRVGCELGFCKGGPAGSMTHDINAVGLAASVVIGWHLRELTNLEAKLCGRASLQKGQALLAASDFAAATRTP